VIAIGSWFGGLGVRGLFDVLGLFVLLSLLS
jgi:hypothetical protein